MGRKRLPLTDKDIEQIEVLAGYGLTVEQIAEALSDSDRPLSERTLYRWQDDKRVKRAFEKGRAMAAGQVGKSLFRQCIEGNISAIVWYEKTRLGRSDRVQLEMVQTQLTEELKEFLALLRDRLPPDEFEALLNEYAAEQADRRGTQLISPAEQ